MEGGSAALDAHKHKGRRVVKPSFEDPSVRLRQEMNSDMLMGTRRNKANGPTSFLDGIYKSVAQSTANLQKPRPYTQPVYNGGGGGGGGSGGGGGGGGGGASGTLGDLDDQIQRATQFLSPRVYNAARSAALSPRRGGGGGGGGGGVSPAAAAVAAQRRPQQPMLQHRLW